MRVTVRVRPGASRTRVGGARGDALIVAVTAPPVEGRATAAAQRALAAAFGVPARSVRLVSGATSRSKAFDIDGDEAVLAARHAELLGEAPAS